MCDTRKPIEISSLDVECTRSLKPVVTSTQESISSSVIGDADDDDVISIYFPTPSVIALSKYSGKDSKKKRIFGREVVMKDSATAESLMELASCIQERRATQSFLKSVPSDGPIFTAKIEPEDRTKIRQFRMQICLERRAMLETMMLQEQKAFDASFNTVENTYSVFWHSAEK